MIRIMIDSLSDITPEEAEALGAELLILPVRFGEEEFYEGRTISRAEFFRRLRACDKELPKTSQITPDGYRHAFKKALEDPKAEVLYLCGSSGLSGCWQSARMARELLPNPERVVMVDTLTAISGCGQLARAACRHREDFRTARELGDWITYLRNHQHTYGQADDLRYLVLGGRINPAVGKVGNTLHLKPMLRFEGGEVHQAGLVRGREKMLRWYAERLEEFPPRQDIPMVVAGADCPEVVQHMVDYFQSLPLALPPIETLGVGAVVGTYVGPGLTSLSWIAEER